MQNQTVGTSPKAVAAAITAAVAPVLAALVARLFGIQVDVETAAAIAGPLVLGGVTFAAARLARPGVVVEREDTAK